MVHTSVASKDLKRVPPELKNSPPRATKTKPGILYLANM
jgi:hypothetical protein